MLGDGSPAADALGLEGEALEARMGPHQVAPVVAYLAHRSCSLTGETLSASGGRVGRVFVGATPGIRHDALTPEVIAAEIESIVDESGYVVPGNVDEELSVEPRLLGG